VLDQPGLARQLSLPRDSDEFSSNLLSSYRLANGVLHNPASDRRTTAGVFHIAEGGLPIQDDNLSVPKATFAKLLEAALQPPADALVLPWTSTFAEPARTWVSLLLRPLVVPATPAYPSDRTMETRFIVPGGLVANLDFVEGIFGNAGDPYLPENDASLDPKTWTGHTGCVILAPHLTGLTKKQLGLPPIAQASERQKRDGMCWTLADELYNGGQAFKACARDARGVVVSDHRGQLLRLLQEGGEDADQLRGQPVRHLRGGALRRRDLLPRVQPWPGVHRHLHPGRVHALRGHVDQSWPVRAPARGPRHRHRRAGAHARSGARELQPAHPDRELGGQEG